jgi:hemolysin activation/secretion protein
MKMLDSWIRRSGWLLLAWLALPAAAQAQSALAPQHEAAETLAAERMHESQPPPRAEVVQSDAVAGSRQEGNASLHLTLGGILVEGTAVLRSSDFAPVIETYLGRSLSPEELAGLARDIAAVARRKGYPLATAWVPEQQLAEGVLSVHLEEGRIDRVEVRGPGHEAVEARLALLADGQPVTSERLERALLLAGDISGVSIGRPRLVRRDGQNVLVVETSRDRVSGRAALENSGSRSSGPLRAWLSVDIAGVLAGDDRLTLGGVVTPAQPRELQYGEASYTIPVDRNGTQVTAHGYAANGRPGGATFYGQITARSLEAGLTLTHALQRSRTRNLWLSGDVTLHDTDVERDGLTVVQDRTVTAEAAVYANAWVFGGWLRARMSFDQGLGILGATERGDTQSSRFGGGAGFSRVYLWSEFDHPLGHGLSVDLRASGQWASRPLLFSDQFGLGGREFARAFDYWEFSGDEGVAGASELRYDISRGLPQPVQRLQFYLFADGGRVSSRDNGFHASLASTGGGIRAWLTKNIQAEFEVAVPLTHGLREERDTRFYFSLSQRF